MALHFRIPVIKVRIATGMAECLGDYITFKCNDPHWHSTNTNDIFTLFEQPCIVSRIPACHIFNRNSKSEHLTFSRKKLPCLLISAKLTGRLHELTVRRGAE